MIFSFSYILLSQLQQHVISRRTDTSSDTDLQQSLQKLQTAVIPITANANSYTDCVYPSPILLLCILQEAAITDNIHPPSIRYIIIHSLSENLIMKNSNAKFWFHFVVHLESYQGHCTFIYPYFRIRFEYNLFINLSSCSHCHHRQNRFQNNNKNITKNGIQATHQVENNLCSIFMVKETVQPTHSTFISWLMATS